MMFIELDLQSETPIYTQIAEQLIEGIARGQLKPGEPLPSVRSLASDLGINLHTVNKAYQTLKQDGFLQVHRKQGVVVQPDTMPGVTAEFTAKLRQQFRALSAEAIVRGMTESEFLKLAQEVYRSNNLQQKGE
ncbi:GntR family transcriptional regulator [Paenibacillus nasutitermitis]|uniref:GntR family transcriptional regulator n=1 Tax=Paenibacillus nasutitermitis TaxID=1652958 RepID=A0A916ZD33_9BACL|nr:GntR family transcriptional regulator [Paenibacillus nasutitermitis]GGD87802.1 GntR family transcriptional regulator [Paenibacillus nasutitermitis]